MVTSLIGVGEDNDEDEDYAENANYTLLKMMIISCFNYVLDWSGTIK